MLVVKAGHLQRSAIMHIRDGEKNLVGKLIPAKDRYQAIIQFCAVGLSVPSSPSDIHTNEGFTLKVKIKGRKENTCVSFRRSQPYLFRRMLI